MHSGGELADFSSFYERTYPTAYRVARGVVGEPGLADDVTQDAYVAAYRERDRFRGDGPADAWLYRIVVNTAISAVRRHRILRIAPVDVETLDRQPAVDQPDAPDDRLAVAEGLRALDARSRSAVVLRYYVDLDYATIASILGTSTSNVGVILTRALDRLRALIEPAPEPAPAAVTQEAGQHG
jgi:RNA polymerase sigma-70 factor, ECF subfamily